MEELPNGRTWVNGQILLNSGPSKRGWHRLGLVLRCPQLYAWTYRNPDPDVSRITTPLARGILIHVALAHHYERLRYYQKGLDGHLVHHPNEAVRLVAGEVPALVRHVDVALEAYAAYAGHWRAEREVHEMEILMVEDVLETTVRGHLFTGRIDLAFKDMAGRIWVCDHKSTSRITKNHKVFYALHGQLWAYLMLARRKYGNTLAGMRVNLVQHTTAKFERFDLPPSQFAEQSIEDVICDAEDIIAQYENRPFDRWPKAQNELTCFHRYGVCDFAEKCLHGKHAKKHGVFTFDPADWS